MRDARDDGAEDDGCDNHLPSLRRAGFEGRLMVNPGDDFTITILRPQLQKTVGMGLNMLQPNLGYAGAHKSR